MANERNGGLNIVVVSGSTRPGNNTGKAAALVVDELRKQPGINYSLIDLREVHLPFPGQAGGSTVPKSLQDLVSKASGIILATPEYHGSFSSAIKLFIENLGYPSALSGKAVALLGVASGQIGAIKALEHLRSVCSHVGALVLPGPVSVANVRSVFDAEGNCLDEKIAKRIRGVATHLLDYIHNHICPKITLESMVREAE
jgi:FMN reductase